MAGPTIVVADDDAKLRKLYADFLGANGFNVMTAGNGLEALSLLHRVQPRMLLLDVVMPELNGIETCRRARQVIDYNTPIVFITSMDYVDHLKEGLEAGGDDYILKSTSLDGILERVRYWCKSTARLDSERRRGKAIEEIREVVEDAALGNAMSNVQWRPDPRAANLSEFLSRALSAVGGIFGQSEQERIYFLGYVAGVVDCELGESGSLKPQFVKYIRSALRSSGIIDKRQIEEMIGSIDVLSANELVRTGWVNGHRDKGAAETGGDTFVPSGLMDFKEVA